MTFKIWIKCIVFCLLWAYGQTLYSMDAESPKIIILADNFTGYKSNIAKSFKLSDLSNQATIQAITLKNWNKEIVGDLYIALGEKALLALEENNIKYPVLASMITSNQWQQFITKHPNNSFNAIFYDPDPIKQIILTKAINPIIKTIGIMTSKNYFLNKEKLDATADKIGLKINYKIKTPEQNFYREYADLSHKNDSILIIPDKENYNQNTIPKAILTSYRQSKLIIGYSKGMVKSGAVATTFTSSSKYIQDLLETSELMLTKPKIEFRRFSQYYSVNTNHAVAKSLGLIIESETVLNEAVEKKLNEIK